MDWPNEIIPPQMDFNIVWNERRFSSIFTNASQNASYPGAFWQAEIDLPVLDQEQARIFSAFIHGLRGITGSFRMPTWHRRPAAAAGNAVVDGGGQMGAQLATRGWSASRQVLRRGDYITINNQLLEVVEDVSSDAQGRATLRFAPWLRSTPVNGDVINYRDPYALMELNESGVSNSFQGIVASGAISCREVV